MKLNNLKKALEYYVLSADCPADERQDVFDALAECNELAERFSSRDLWEDTVYLVSSDSLAELLNIATYDDYGKRAKIHGEHVPFDYYAHDARHYVLTDMTNRSLQLGYEIVRDLWHDNEADGANNPDGTFNRGFGTLTSEDLCTIVDTLKEQLDGISDGTTHDRILSIIGKIEC